MSSILAIVRIRGRTHINSQIEDTLRSLGLTRKNNAIILQADASGSGMIKKVKDYITWGEVDEKTIVSLLKSRGKITGGKPLTDDYVKDNSKYSNIGDLAKAVSDSKAKLKEVEGLKVVFKLNPPLKGFERGGIKQPFTKGGALGYRSEKINELISRMI